MGVDRGASTEEYSSSTAGYSAQEEEGTHGVDSRRDHADPAGGGPAAVEKPAAKQGFWIGLGFESREAYMSYLQRQQSLQPGWRRGERVPVARMPADEVAELETPPPRLELRNRQVNVKLRRSEGKDLDSAARDFGVAPSTLARMLVNRGVKAILERE